MVLLSLAICLTTLTPALAQLPEEDEDPVFFVISPQSTYYGGSGWYAGYVVIGQSGTYTLNISANGPKAAFPITNIKVIALISNESQAGGLKSLSINNVPITTFNQGRPAYYTANGGPFQEPDYYGYSDQYVIPQLTYEQISYPKQWYQINATIEFASNATTQSKVMFLIYGTDAKGKPAETPFSGGTMFVVPEYTLPLLNISACLIAYATYKKINKTKPKNH
jgi:hypothetical protein